MTCALGIREDLPPYPCRRKEGKVSETMQRMR